MEWLQRPVFSEDGKSWRLERVKEVPDGQLQRFGTMTLEEFRVFWGQ